MLKYFSYLVKHVPKCFAASGSSRCLGALAGAGPVHQPPREGRWAGALTVQSTAPLPRGTAWLWRFPGIETSKGGMRTHTCTQARVSELDSKSSSFSSGPLALAVSSGCCSLWG